MKKIEKIILLVVFVIALLPLIDLLKPGLPVTHDGQDHVARIANFYTSLSEGNIIPRWAGNLNWGYGHPILMFLYPLPSYFASLFKAVGFSFVDATKLVFGVSYIASIFAMYLWTRSRWGIAAGFVAAVLYGFAPYRFVDLYVRGAIGEHVAFIFPPLILWGVDGISKMQNRGVIISLATAALILSHNAVSLMFLPIIGLYVLYLFHFQSSRNFKFLLLTVYYLLLGFALSAFFWLPAFFEGKYTLRDIVTKGELSGRFVPWSWFFSSPWNYGGGNQFTKSIGLAQWIVVLGSLFLLKKRSTRLLVGSFLILFLVSLFLMTDASSLIWKTVTMLQKFQFPWRLLSVTVFLGAALGGIVVPAVSKKYVWKFALGLSLLAIVTTSSMWKAKEYMIKPESFYTGVYKGTTDTGESSPIWSVRFMEHISSSKMEVIDGNAIIEEGRRTTTRHEYTVQASVKTRLVENTLYFPGWRVLVDGIPTTIEFQDPTWRGLMTFFVEPGDHRIEIIFEDTKLRKFAHAVTMVGIVFLLISLYGKTFIR